MLMLTTMYSIVSTFFVDVHLKANITVGGTVSFHLIVSFSGNNFAVVSATCRTYLLSSIFR